MSYARRSQPCRCWRCNGRRTIAKPMREYARKPKCLACGTASLYLCKDRLPSRWGKRHRCKCEGYHFPHRRGSKFCEHNPRYDQHWHERHEARAA